MNKVIELRLAIESDALHVTAVNTGERNLRLWSRDNSWGWSMFSLLLALPGSDQWRELAAKPIRWTANVPRALLLPAGGRLDFSLRRDNPAWKGADDLGAWLTGPLQVRVRLRVDETAEALAQEVFIGEVLSPPCLSQPPHTWLTGQA